MHVSIMMDRSAGATGGEVPKELELLKGVSGFAVPGKLMALMGGSGAGETPNLPLTLLQTCWQCTSLSGTLVQAPSSLLSHALRCCQQPPFPPHIIQAEFPLAQCAQTSRVTTQCQGDKCLLFPCLSQVKPRLWMWSAAARLWGAQQGGCWPMGGP